MLLDVGGVWWFAFVGFLPRVRGWQPMLTAASMFMMNLLHIWLCFSYWYQHIKFLMFDRLVFVVCQGQVWLAW